MGQTAFTSGPDQSQAQTVSSQAEHISSWMQSPTTEPPNELPEQDHASRHSCNGMQPVAPHKPQNSSLHVQNGKSHHVAEPGGLQGGRPPDAAVRDPHVVEAETAALPADSNGVSNTWHA